MPRKEPLYFKKSKAAEQLDYDYYPESEMVLRKYDYRKVKLQKTKKQYDYPNYDGHNPYRSDYNYDVDGNKYLVYELQSSTEFSEPEVVLEGHHHKHSKDRVNQKSEKLVPDHLGHHHKHSKDRVNQKSENLVPDHLRKIKGSNNIMKQRSPQQSYYENDMLKDKKDITIYLSQRPITLHYESQEDFNVPLESRKPRIKEQKRLEIPAAHSIPPGDHETYPNNFESTPNDKIFGKEQQGDSFEIYSTLTHTNNMIPEKNVNELTSDIAQSLARLIYLPILVMSNNSILQSIGSMQPTARIVSGANKQPYSTDLVDESHKTMSVFMANNTNMNSVFRQNIDSTIPKGSTISLTERSKENINKEMMAPSKLKNEIKSKLCASPLGTAMSAESYANLIASHNQQKSKSGDTFISIIKAKKAQSQIENNVPLKKVEKSKVENEYPKIECSEDPVNDFKEHFISRSQSKENYTAKQENKRNKSESISYYMNNKIEEGEENKKKPPCKEKTKLPQNGHEDLEEVEEAERIIININKNYPINGKPSLVPKKTSIISQDPMIMASYKKVGQSQCGLKPKTRFLIQEQGVSLAKDQESDRYKTNFQLKENHCDNKIHPYTYIVQSLTLQTEEGREKSLPKQNNNEITVLPKNEGFRRELPLNELKDTPGASAQTGEEKKYENNPKHILKSESLVRPIEKTSSRKKYHEREMMKYKLSDSAKTGEEKEYANNPRHILKSESLVRPIEKTSSRKKYHEREMMKYKISQEHLKKSQKENSIKSISNTAQLSKQQPKKPTSVAGDKIRKSEEHGEEFQTAIKSHSEQNKIDETNQLLVDKKGDSSSMEYLLGKPTVDIIHPPPEKVVTKRSSSSILLLQNEGKGEPLNDQPSQLLIQSEGKSEPLNDQPSQSLIQNEGKSEPLNDQQSQLLIQNEGKSELLNDQPSQILVQNEENSESLSDQSFELLGYTEAILIIAFQTAQYILGVSCFNKLTDVADFYYYEDD